MKIAIIDYQLSNLFSVKHALEYLKIDCQITSDPKLLLSAGAAILPGVGAFGDAMNNLKRFNLISPIKEFIKSGKPFMGVCLGMQLLFSQSEEFGIHAGLNIVPGNVKKFSRKHKPIKVPQIGWNQISLTDKKLWANSPLKNIKSRAFMYFVHSYYVIPQDKSVILSETDYEGIKYCSSLLINNMFATQFHPEKSGVHGITIYNDWLKMSNK